MPFTASSLFFPTTRLLLPTCCILFIVSGILAGCGDPTAEKEKEKPAEKPVSSEAVVEEKEPPVEKPASSEAVVEEKEPPAEKPVSSEAVVEEKEPPAEPVKPEVNKPVARSATRDFAFLGVFTEAIDKTKKDSGLRVVYVYPGSAGNDMGLKEGDEIIALNDFLIPNRDRFVAELRKENIGATIRFLLNRDGNKIKLKGKIKSFKKTMQMIQDRLREKYVGKPLAALPETLWWNSKTAMFESNKAPLAAFKGKIGLLVAYDDCIGCKRNRINFLSQLFTRTKAAGSALPLAFAGVYQSDTQLNKGGSKECLSNATKLYTEDKPPFPAGIAHFPAGAPLPKEREATLYLHNHGVVITDPLGKVAYLQVTGYPDQVAIQKTIGEIYVKHFQKKGTPPDKSGNGK